MVRKRTVIGLMSGTSLDGADAALVDFWEEDGRVRHALREFLTLEMPAALRADLLAAMAPGPISSLGPLSMRMGDFLADAALAVMAKAGIDADQVDLVASHGQTIWHDPGRASLQIGEPALIAHRTGLTVVADFRPADIAAGGQGAPLVPLADRELYGEPGRNLVLLNIGGIANLTWLPATGPPVAFDTGPGNMVVDAVCKALTGQPFDRGGLRARAGRIDEALLADLLADPFFVAPPPRSTGRERFGEAYAAALLARAGELGLSPDDLLATVTALSARTIGGAIRDLLPGRPEEIRVSGGGAHNGHLLALLERELPGVSLVVLPDADAKEAVAFALLAYRTAFGQPSSVPEATGAKRAQVLGKIAPGANFARLALARPGRTRSAGGLATTETAHPESGRLDAMTPGDLAALMAEETYAVAQAVERVAGDIAEGISLVARRLAQGGRLFYVGAGTSGRLGVLDAAECPPTFSTPPDLVQGLVAGGPPALLSAIEGAEDDAEAGAADLAGRALDARDVVVGLSASGSAAYVDGALESAKALGCATLLVTCNAELSPGPHVDRVIAPIVGPEILSGSTRLKAGTATKIVLNALSTGAMVLLGKVYGNQMVDVHVSNNKLRARAERILAEVAGVPGLEAAPLLAAARGSVKVAIAMRRLGLGADEARARLEAAGGRLRALLES